MESQLTGSHEKVYQRLFQHPMPHNLQWREVRAMLEAIGDINTVEDDKGNLKLARGSQTLVLHRPRGKDLADKQELMQVRHFLERSVAAPPPAPPAGTHLLVVLDHREARIYSAELRGTVPQRIMPYDPFGFGRDLRYNQDDSNGQRKPEQRSFYESIAKTLSSGQQILLFGEGTGASSAMEQLILNLKQHHPDIAKKVVGSKVVDMHHLTEAQLLAEARELFAGG
jgi:hypothetical protein